MLFTYYYDNEIKTNNIEGTCITRVAYEQIVHDSDS
jgi:hypothetical protein